MEFRKAFDRNIGGACPSGEKIVPTYSLVVDKETGKTDLKATGKTNMYDFIQSSLNETLVYNVIERYNAGDVTALDKVSGFFGDVTTFPKNLAEAQQLLINAKKTFDSLPLEVRAKYNHSVSEFLSSVEKEANSAAVSEARAALIADQEAKLAELKAKNSNLNQGGND